MYLNIDGFNKINDGIQRERQQTLENQRRATQDARTAETHARQQKQWGLEDAAQAEVANQAGQLGGLASAKGYDWRRVAGVPEEDAAAGLAAPTNRAAIDQYTPPAEQSPAGLASGKALAPVRKPTVANPMDDELAQIQNMAKLAAATRDPKQLAQAQAAFFDHKKRRTAMEMSDYFDKATPDELSRMAGAITADSTNKVKAVYDKDSGFTRLETDDGVQTLRPAELKKYLIAKAVGNIDGMAAAQQSNIARTDKDNSFTEKVAESNNRAGYQSGMLDARNAALEAKGEAVSAKMKLAEVQASTKPLNDSQSKALLFGSRMREADKVLSQLASEGTTTSVPGSRLPGIGGVITSLSSGNRQMLDQAKTDFMTATLRRESGASISAGEFDTANKQYFPQIGDSPKVIAQKSANRQLALRGILMEVPEHHRDSLQPLPAAAGPSVPTNPSAAPRAPAAPDTSTKVSRQVQAERDKDRVGILNAELASAHQRLASGDARAQGDVDSLSRELALATRGSQGQRGRNAPNQITALPKDRAALQVGGVYQTARGPAKWNGSAFEAQ